MARIIINILLLFSLTASAQTPMAMFHAHNQTAGGLLLDTYPGAREAVSFRKLSSIYNSYCIRVQRLSDNTTQDIGFINNYLDTASLKTFVGASDGVLYRWYSQSGSGNYYSVVDSTARIYIIKSGAILYDNGKVTARNSDNAATVNVLWLNSTSMIYHTLFAVVKVNTQNTVNYITWGQETGYFGGFGIHGSAVTGWFGYDNVSFKQVAALTRDLNRHLAYFTLRGGSLYIAKDGGAENNAGTFATSDEAATQIFGRGQTNTQMLGQAQEYIFYTSENSANKAAIEANINSYYSIY